jgi:signal transduction histidine kinase
VLIGDLLSRHYGVIGVPAGLAEAAGDIVRAVVATVILLRLIGPRAAMDRLSHVGGVLVAVATGEAIAATVAMFALWANDIIGASGLAVFWPSWWLGGLAGGLVVVPLALAWAQPLALVWRGRLLEASLMLVSVIGLSALALLSAQPSVYFVFGALIWAALRFGPQGATLAVAVAVVEAVVVTSQERGPFHAHAASDSALNLQLYIVFAALITLCLAAIVSERRRAALEVVESRARLAGASSRERRKLERDLHDGAQQRLVAASINLSLAGELADRNPELQERVSDACSEVEAALAELREVAHGIYPQALGRWGLARALAVLAARYPRRVEITLTTTARFPPEVEAAMFYCCNEAAQNASKHAGPDAHITIRLTRDVDQLRLEVRDNGRGFDVAAAHDAVGLQNMHDRLGAVRGSVEIASQPGQGTIVVAMAPVRRDP